MSDTLFDAPAMAPSAFTDGVTPVRDPDFSARRTDPPTSKIAAAQVRKESMTALVLAELSLGKGSDRQVADRLKSKGFPQAAEAVHKRRPELEKGGYVRFTGETHKHEDGFEGRVYKLTYVGRLRAGVEVA